mmetsp:Transcript_39898/g.61067  ORF Transcript_39898/g.61067 Transcript_39898/m.61067 type:complete len:110 (+) Transcript_39898:2739-3068(+)
MSCEMDPNFIIIQGTPPFESKDETTLIRIYDDKNYVVRQFEVKVEEKIDPSNSTIVQNSSIDQLHDRGSFVSQQSFSRMYTMRSKSCRSNRNRSLRRSQKSQYSRKGTH